MLKIIIAPNALKGSLSAADAADAIETGILQVCPDAQTLKLPIADGGDGLSEVLAKSLAASHQVVSVKNPLGKVIEAHYLYCANRQLAVIEMASAAGLALLNPAEYDPLSANTYGVGQMILSALNLGVKKIVLGIGGSATNDAGTGLANALGVQFFDANNQEIIPCGGNLSQIKRIDNSKLDKRLATVELLVACDVENPLLGDFGAARIYAPQKGATNSQVELLESGLGAFADVMENFAKKSVRNLPGAGAAGGLGAGMMAFLGAKLFSGAELVLDLLDFQEKAVGADLVITAEGKLDDQSRYGKAPFVLAQKAAQMNIPCVAIVGQAVGEIDHFHKMGFSAVYSLCTKLITSEYAIRHASELMADISRNLMASLSIQYTFQTKIKKEHD